MFNWSFVYIYERPILGENPKPHFLAFPWNPADFKKSSRFQCEIHMKSSRFHEIHQIWGEICWISCLKTYKSDNSRKKLHFHRVQGEAMSFELCEIHQISWNPMDFIHTKDHLPGLVSLCFQFWNAVQNKPELEASIQNGSLPKVYCTA